MRRPVVDLSDDARSALRPDEALVFDWHRVAICCAAAGEVSLRTTRLAEVERSGAFVPLADGVYAHRRAYPHMAGRRIAVGCRRRLGIRRFTSDLPADFGLRASLGRLEGTA